MTELAAVAASAQILGRRNRQEDALVARFSRGSGTGLAVLSDGMGGHDDGDLASRILANEMFGEIYDSAVQGGASDPPSASLLRAALDTTNRRLCQKIEAGCLSADTGGTLLTVSVRDGLLRWISVGDSPLYLWRCGALHRLNEIHSVAAQLDLMVRQGALDEATVNGHPQRNCLTSAVTGQEVPRVDCPERPLELLLGDIVLMASDGLNVLSDGDIGRVISLFAHVGSPQIAHALLKAVENKQEPHQDNTTVAVISMIPADCRARVQGPEIRHKLAAFLPDAIHRLKGFAEQVVLAATRGTRF